MRAQPITYTHLLRENPQQCPPSGGIRRSPSRCSRHPSPAAVLSTNDVGNVTQCRRAADHQMLPLGGAQHFQVFCLWGPPLFFEQAPTPGAMRRVDTWPWVRSGGGAWVALCAEVSMPIRLKLRGSAGLCPTITANHEFIARSCRGAPCCVCVCVCVCQGNDYHPAQTTRFNIPTLLRYRKTTNSLFGWALQKPHAQPPSSVFVRMALRVCVCVWGGFVIFTRSPG